MAFGLTATIDNDAANALVTLDWNGSNEVPNPTFRKLTGALVEVRRNLAINPSGEGASGWIANNGATSSVTTDASVAHSGASSRRGEVVSAGAALLSLYDVGGTGIPASVGKFYTGSVYVRSQAGGATGYVVIAFLDASNVQITGATGTTVALPDNGDWVRLSSTSAAAPANTSKVRLSVFVEKTGSQIGEQAWADSCLIEEATAVLPYFDGTSADTEAGWSHLWQSTAHASASIERGPSISPGNMSPYAPTVGTSVGGDRLRLLYKGGPNLVIWAFQTDAMHPITAGQYVAGRMQIRQVGGTGDLVVNPRVSAYSGTLVTILTEAAATVTLPPDGDWVDVELPSKNPAGAGVVSVRQSIYPSGVTPPGSTIEVRRVSARVVSGPGVRPDAYFDGSMPGFVWSGAADASSSLPSLPSTATIDRVSASGVVAAVRNADPAQLVSGVWIGSDYETPLDEDFFYRATSTAAPGFELLSASYFIASDGRTLLKHPGRPALNIAARVERAPSVTRPITQGIYDVLGRSTPIAVSMRRGSARGELDLTTYDEDERNAMLLLLDDGSPLLLQSPRGYGIGNVYIAVGEVTEQRVTGTGYEWARRWSLPFVVVDSPTGGALAVGNTWADALAAYGSWSELLSGEGTWAGLLEGPGS